MGKNFNVQTRMLGVRKKFRLPKKNTGLVGKNLEGAAYALATTLETSYKAKTEIVAFALKKADFSIYTMII